MNIVESKVTNLLKEKLDELGYVLVKVQYLKENKENFLRITVDKDDDISLEEIVHLSDLISPLLDVNDVIKDKYILDITTLGIEKEININKLDKYLNKYLNIHLSNPYKGLNNLIGALVNVDKESVTLKINDKGRIKDIILSRKFIDKVHLAIKF